MKKIAMLLSGGVDSSVALSLLVKEAKYDIKAYYLKIWLEEEFAFLGDCPWEEDLKYARSVCDHFRVPLEVVSLQRPYWDLVVAHTVSELKAGRTPSPDILCNQRIKYGAFTNFISDSVDKIASGHYARVEEDGSFSLLKGVDPVKDQTYFLSHLSQEQLGRCMFPLGGFTKDEVREKAKDFDLPNQDRRDSQGICFLGKIRYNEFVKGHLGEAPGVIKEKSSGKILGKHKGYWFHTVGQRKGLGLGGGPWFVVGKDVKRNIVYVERSTGHEERLCQHFAISPGKWINGAPDEDREYSVKIRHGARTTHCRLKPSPDGEATYEITMVEPDGGVAPGQYAVVYDGDTCLGGGTISHRLDL